ncbi:ADP-ribosylation factor-like protein 8B [Glugoides intestinalis]
MRKSLKSLFASFGGKKEVSMCILGLDACGKTTLVHVFKGIKMKAIPTLGFNSEKITIENTEILIWDIGGQHEFLQYWDKYVKGVNGLIFMVDIADEKRFQESFNGLKSVADQMKDNTPILLLLNKCDLFDKNSGEVEKRLLKIEKLYKIDNEKSNYTSFMNIGEKSFKTKISLVSVLNDFQAAEKDPSASLYDSSVYPGFKWLVDEIKNNNTTSNNND